LSRAVISNITTTLELVLTLIVSRVLAENSGDKNAVPHGKEGRGREL